MDIDGDGVGYRSLPGTDHPKAAFFTRGTGHDEYAVYSEKSEAWVKNMDRLLRKFDTAREMVPGPVINENKDAEIGIIAYGTTHFAIEEARDRLAAENLNTSYMRLRALPINDEVKDFVARHDRVYVVELNRDGQMHSILLTEMPEMATKLISLAHLDGMSLTARWVQEAIEAKEQG
jgi:2-oxoglutarate ferredoxin oxidoreductase subunit alpha